MHKTTRFFFSILASSFLCTHVVTQADNAPVLTTDPFITDINEFATSLYSQTTKTGEANTVFSPYSIFTCLSMAYIGAQGTTAVEMAHALSLNISKNQLALKSGQLSSDLKANASEYAYELNIANAMWLDQDTFILSDYRHAIQNEFDAKIESLNFADTEKSVSIINEWTSNQTQGKIPHLLTQDDVSALTRLVLTNAIYFKGSWEHPFNEKTTHEAPFNSSPDEAHSVPMMDQTNSFSYYESEDMQFLCMPFSGTNESGTKIACFFALPKPSSSLHALESSFSAPIFKSWMNGLDFRKVHVKVPKFTMDYRMEMKETLKAMGMVDAFSKQANFSGIDGLLDLYIDNVIHQAFFALDEKGVTAAAATAVTINVKSAVEPSLQPIEFILDRPFLFGIVDLKSKVMLFLGKVVDPKSDTAG